ncbi:hypothetical protein [Kitasatospora sp. NPDC059673]|uniref:hypothetical protein n=1 Tax=Kitasatospora sp. NPDC059673 TaxID=3346901 RepID=UPI00367F10CD
MLAVVLAAVLTGCSGVVPTPMPVPSGSPAPATASGFGLANPAQELAEFRAALAAPAQPFSAVLKVQVTDGTLTVRRQGVVNVSDGLQTASLSVVSASASVSASAPAAASASASASASAPMHQQGETQAYLTITRQATYTRAADHAWVRSPHPPEPLLTDHRPLAQALLQSDPSSFHGKTKLRTLRGGLGFHLVGRLPRSTVAEALDAAIREQLAQHQVPDCTTDLLIDADGRLSELTLTCEANGYQLRSTTTLTEYGPAAETGPPADL